MAGITSSGDQPRSCP